MPSGRQRSSAVAARRRVRRTGCRPPEEETLTLAPLVVALSGLVAKMGPWKLASLAASPLARPRSRPPQCCPHPRLPPAERLLLAKRLAPAPPLATLVPRPLLRPHRFRPTAANRETLAGGATSARTPSPSGRSPVARQACAVWLWLESGWLTGSLGPHATNDRIQSWSGAWCHYYSY